jgi:hypothetical protein
MNLVSFHTLWSIGLLAKNKPHDVACAQVLLNLAAKPGIPLQPVDGKLTAAFLEALKTFQTKVMGLSSPMPFVDPGSTTIKALVHAAIPGAQRLLQFPTGKASLIGEGDYQAAAQSLGCEVAAVKAVAAVESMGHGFLPNGKPKILFEAHIFSRETQHRYDHLFPDISSRHQNHSLYRKGAAEYHRLEKAMLLERTAALRSASWGKFQIVAMNHKLAGQPDLTSFISAMFQSEGAQLDAFCAFVTSKGLVKALRSHDWASFAFGYNGPEYYKKHYDRRMREEYDRARGGAVHATTR